MLELKNIKKDYPAGDNTVHALKGVSLKFRKSEFVSILGQSGCGKTTMLNIIGGLDQYTSGDLVINGVSTKNYKDRDWDSYRNHSVGFVFQSYNLIPHQSVLQNVELALTLSGVSKAERRQRAKAALESVGLGTQFNKKPSEMSGGQMQRVAIARAIVNNPDIILADEPTGALDSETSLQVMDILKEISKDRLVIMVTHNPEIAENYSTRIVRMLDGVITSDSNPPSEEEIMAEREEEAKEKRSNKKEKKPSMSFFTSFGLSLKNLFTKKGRTMLTSFAGSIGIIGIALILAVSQGTTAYIDYVQESTLSSYPLTIQEQMQDFSAMMGAMTDVKESMEAERDPDKIYVDDSMGTMMGAMSATTKNNLEKFKAYIDTHYDDIKPYLTGIQYTYNYDLQVFNVVADVDEDGNPITVARKIGMDVIFDNMGSAFSGMSELMDMSGSMGGMGMNVFSEMLDNQELLDQQYDVIAGKWPTEYNEVVLVVTPDNQISKMTLYMLGMRDPSMIEDEVSDLMSGKYESEDIAPYTFDEILNTKFMLLTTEDFFVEDQTKKPYSANGKEGGYPIWKDVRKDFDYDQTKYVTENGIELKISGIIRPKKGASATSISGTIGYTKEFTNYILEQNSDSKIISQQKETPNVNVLTGLTFERTVYTRENIQELIDKVDKATMDMFYSYITNYIKSDESTSALLTVNRANVNTMFMLLPEKDQAAVLEKMISSALENNPTGSERIFTTMSSMTGGIDVTKDNIYILLPILNQMQTMPLITAIGIPGLLTLSSPEVVKDVIDDINEKHPEFAASPMGAVTEQNFGMMIGRLPKDEQTAAYKALVDGINEGNDAMLSILCGVLSAQSGMEFTGDNIAEILPTLPAESAMIAYVASSGVAGFADYATEATMTEVYAEMNELIMNLEVDDKIFSLLLLAMPDDMFTELEARLYEMAPQIDATLDSVLEELDDAEKAKPASINFYAIDFESKDKVEEFIADYNDSVEEADKLKYADMVGMLMSSVTTIIDAITYVLIAFVSISLVVSSIMIGVITLISVQERTKEIGILRAIGASKQNVSQMFNAETMIIGFTSGFLGVIVTYLLCIPINLILNALTGIEMLKAVLPWQAAIALVVISVLLTLISGIIPSASAAKKDPVVALRTE